ncbi:MAG: FkbM family methyltransferase [Gammaproteobacteria bacterium]|nr:FkbM family methyltransferase [Gammaproteobacteria bacterium]
MIKILRKIKRILKSLIGRDFFSKEQIEIDKVMHGGDSGYGGWDIHEGDINANSIVYSFGVGEDASFDISLIKKFGLTVFAFDPTPKSIAWVKSQGFPAEFRLYEYGLADFDGSISFNPPSNPDHVSHTILDREETNDTSIEVNVKRLKTIMEELGHEKIDLLKMDIEGAEYQVIEDFVNSDVRPKQLLIEFHHRFPSVGIEKSKSAIEKLNKIGYMIFSVSDIGEEYSFIYKM